MADLGNFIRLHPLHTNELPNHSALNSLIHGPKGKQASNGNTPTNGAVTRPDLRQFITHILAEASNFAEHTVPDTFTSKGLKQSPPSTNGVELLTHSYPQDVMQNVCWRDPRLPRQWSGHGVKPAENWFARRSRHANHDEPGTANFSELDYGLRHDHSEHEMSYTPDVYDCYEVLNWDSEIERELEKGGSIKVDTGIYTEVHMSIREMCHKLPPPLLNRVFSVLVITAKGPQAHSFLVVQMPVDISNVTSAMYSNNRNLNEGKTRSKRKRVVLGVYTSIERGQILPDQNIEWLMATTSDAKGWLPMYLQKLGVPGAVIKDVGLFMKWIDGVRRNRGKSSFSYSIEGARDC